MLPTCFLNVLPARLCSLPRRYPECLLSASAVLPVATAVLPGCPGCKTSSTLPEKRRAPAFCFLTPSCLLPVVFRVLPSCFLAASCARMPHASWSLPAAFCSCFRRLPESVLPTCFSHASSALPAAFLRASCPRRFLLLPAASCCLPVAFLLPAAAGFLPASCVLPLGFLRASWLLPAPPAADFRSPSFRNRPGGFQHLLLASASSIGNPLPHFGR